MCPALQTEVERRGGPGFGDAAGIGSGRRRTRRGAHRPRRPASRPTADARARPLVATAELPPPQTRMLRYLPLAIAATATVIVLPAVVVAALMPRGGVVMTLCSALAGIALSVALAATGAALWKRQPRSRDVVFADLMLWCWLRRYRTEQRLSQARDLFEAARKAGPDVNIELLLGLSRLLEARDAYLHGHSQRVARHAVQIARAMGLSPREVAKIRTAAEVHDVGKLYTPREILNSPYPLNKEEFEVVKRHAPQGAEMVSVVGDPEITAMVRHHHERIDGGGYPDGLVGAEIPLGARIIAVADTFDAITSDRAYRSAGSQKRALDVLAGEAGAQLDPHAVAAFQQGYSARRSVAWYAAGAVVAQRVAFALQSLTSNFGLGFASVGALAPAVGAAGVLALSPGVFRASQAPHPSQPAPGESAALVQPLDAAVGSGATGGAGLPQRGGARGGRPLAHVEPLGPSRSGLAGGGPGSGSAPATGGGSATPNGLAPAGGSSGGAGGSGGGSPAAGGSAPIVGEGTTPVKGLPEATLPKPGGGTPSVTVPSMSTPSVSTPTLSTPGVTTPRVTTPGVSAAGVAVPSVTVPSVTIPGVTVPPVTVPPVKLPSVKLGG
ncbi:MAG TPA: HD-GYP domain-containing protein [Solirubrobacteraceae bacterium]|nr:HD-GYP domain-containing protein [Solirubrobacteraceae bacterium]